MMLFVYLLLDDRPLFVYQWLLDDGSLTANLGNDRPLFVYQGLLDDGSPTANLGNDHRFIS